MKHSEKLCRIGVFYDGNYLLHASNYYNYNHPQRRRLSLSGIHKFVKTKVAEFNDVEVSRCQIAQAHYFRGRLNAADAANRGNQLYNDRVFDDILMSEGIHTHYLPLRNMMGRREERGIDVWLSLEAYELALSGGIDAIVLIVSDADYTPLVRKITTLGIPVIILGWDFEYTTDDGVRMVTKTSHELLTLATYPLAMEEIISDGLDDRDPLIESLFVSSDQNYRSNPDAELENSTILSLKNGFGFIRYPNNNLFFHSQDVIGDFFDLEVGDTVEFITDKNTQNQDVAKEVRRISGSEESDSEIDLVDLDDLDEE